MNEQLSNQLAEILKASKDGVINISAIIQAQAPDLAKQIINWEIFDNLICALFAVILFYALFPLWGIVKEWETKQITGGMIIIAAILILMWFMSSIENLIKCLCAPKLVVIDYLKDLIPKKD